MHTPPTDQPLPPSVKAESDAALASAAGLNAALDVVLGPVMERGPAPMTRDEALRLNRQNSTDTMHFTPFDGRCYRCNDDLVAQYGIEAIAAGLNVTGCRKCHRSFCD